MKLSGNSSGYFLPVCVYLCVHIMSLCVHVLYLYVCICVISVYIHMCVVRVYTCVCVSTCYVCVYMYTSVYIHVCVYTRVYLCLCVYVCYVCVYLVSVCMYVSILGAGRRAVITLSPIPGWGWNLLGAIRPLHGPHPPLPTPPPLIWAR